MAYVVEVGARAERDLAYLYGQINAGNSDAAMKWYLELRDAILSLRDQPNRCPITPENVKLRHLLFGHKPHVYRVIYRILEKRKRVVVIHIRHGARREF
jgi:toxin ParE1/3/4